MAAVTSGVAYTATVASGSTPNSRFYVSWAQQSQSAESNSTTITWEAGWEGLPGTAPQYKSNAIKILDGSSIAGQTITAGVWSNQSGAGTHPLRSGTATIIHDTEGKASFSTALAAWFYSDKNLTCSGSWELTQIPRASTVALSSASVAVGGSQTVTITRASTSFTHDITWKIGAAVIGSHTGVATSQAFTIPASAASAVPAKVSDTCTVTVTTKSGSTVIGTTTTTFTVTIPDTDTYKPSFNAVVSRVDNTVPTAWGVAVQHQSKGKVDLTSAAAGTGATLARWSVKGPTYSSDTTLDKDTASYTTTDVIRTSGTVSVVVTVTDSRGRATSKTVTMTVEAYAPPTITPSQVWRCDSAGAANQLTGTYASVLATWAYASCASKNTATTKLEYKVSTATTWTTQTVTLTSGTRATVGAAALQTTSTYDVRLTVTDGLGGVAQTQWSVGTAQVDLDFRADANGIGIGGVGETAGAIDAQWWINARRGIAQTLNSRVVLPLAYSYYNSASSMTGVLKLALPVAWNSTMMVLAIRGFNYSANSAWTITIGGYNYSNAASSAWTNTSVMVHGSPPCGTTVRLAYDGTACCVLLGTTTTVWSYPGLSVAADLHYTGGTADAWKDPAKWAASFYTTEPTWTPAPVTPPLVPATVGALTVTGTPTFATGIATMNGSWYEERLGTNFYRWTQTTTVTVAMTTSWGSEFYGTANLPTKPTGATITSVSVTPNNNGMTTMPNVSGWTVDCVRPLSQSSGTYSIIVVAYGTK
ncbi:MAG: DUF859 domain-containing protein [Propionibacteriaceae bacterium]|jgi:hypothetical protein|nr:DUF859 domain-containing protein [Propionibacteriaceae bacterium]